MVLKRLFDIGITDPKWYLAVNFLLLGSALFPSTIKNIIVNAINMVILLMPRQKIKNNKLKLVFYNNIKIVLKELFTKTSYNFYCTFRIYLKYSCI